MLRERADVLGNRHAVVVEHHQQIGADTAGMIQGFKGETSRERAVANDGDAA